MLTGRLLAVLGLTLCLVASSATADILGFTVDSLNSTFDGTTFTALNTTGALGSTGTFVRYETPTGIARFYWDTFATGSFSLSMKVTGVTGNPTYAASGVGSFTATDIGGDTITGDMTGQWVRDASDSFHGSLSNVRFTDNGLLDGSFDGHVNSISMSFAIASPWSGGITDLVVTNAPWFATAWPEGGYVGGSVDATVTAIPLPSSILLCFLGLGGLGLKRVFPVGLHERV
jgi:hypothetical protein